MPTPGSKLRVLAGVDSATLGVVAMAKFRGWGVGNLSRGRVVEFMTERRNERRRVCGVKGSSSSA